MARRPIIAGNWKMNNTIADGVKLVKELAPLVKDNKTVDIVVCPTATALA
ncbi:MAG: triose-phosphate isomerase, partial [Selenomonadaceae bacterium]|nr:triose-phosphate isomerase [Selenomonadaceae bacterium]